MSIHDIERELAVFTESNFNGGVNEEAIQQAEIALGVLFPFQYRQFLLHFGSGSVSSEEFVGLGGPKHLNVVWLANNLRNREGRFPNCLIPLRADGYGNYDCLDTSKPKKNGEFPIVEWVHGSEASHAWKTLASSFDEWFVDLLRMIKKHDEDDRM